MDRCSSVLAARSVYSYSNDRKTKYAILRLVSKEMYESNSQGFEALIPTKFGPIEANWNAFNEARNSYLNKMSLDFDEEESVSILQEMPAEGAIEAWRDCMTRNENYLYAILEESTEENVTFKVFWDAIPALGYLKECKIVPSMGEILDGGDFVDAREFSGTTYVTFSRGASERRVSARISGKAGVVGGETRFSYWLKCPAPVPPRARVKDVAELYIPAGAPSEISVKLDFDQKVRLSVVRTFGTDGCVN